MVNCWEGGNVFGSFWRGLRVAWSGDGGFWYDVCDGGGAVVRVVVVVVVVVCVCL